MITRTIIRLVNSLENLDPRNFAGQLLITPNGDVYTPELSDELGSIGSFFKKLGQVALPLAGAIAAPFTGGLSASAAKTLTSTLTAAGSVAGGLLGVLGNGSGGNGQQAKGLAAIQAKGQQVIQAFDQLNQKIQSDAAFAKADAPAAADRLVAILSDSSEFYQAKSGKDAEALAGFKTQAAQLAAQSKSLAARALQTTTGAGGQTVQPASSLPFGLSTTELVLGALGVYFLFFRSSN